MFAILGGILSFLGVVAMNPMVQKLALFGFFYSILVFTVDYFINLVVDKLPSLGYIYNYASYLGVLQAVSIVLSFVISGFFVRNILAYLK